MQSAAVHRDDMRACCALTDPAATEASSRRSSRRIPDGATWIDLEEPTNEEEALVERCIDVNVPTQDEMAEIEPSSRLYERNGALYMTVSVLRGVDGRRTRRPRRSASSLPTTGWSRSATRRPSRCARSMNHVRREPELARDAPTVLVRLLDAIIDRLADELESRQREIEQISQHIFQRDIDERRIPAARLTALLTRIGRAQTLLTKIRYSAVSTIRMLSFLAGSNRVHEDARQGRFGIISPASTPTSPRSASMRASCPTISPSCSTRRSGSSASSRMRR